MVTESVKIFEISTQTLVSADLCHFIDSNHLEHYRTDWQESFEQLKLECMFQHGLLEHEFEYEDGHWEWNTKLEFFLPQPNAKAFALVSNNMTQGLLLMTTGELVVENEHDYRFKLHRSRHHDASNEPCVHVEYVHTAPWNRRIPFPAECPSFTCENTYGLVGMVLIRAALAFSFSEGCNGRVGLFSLPSAEQFYSSTLGMVDFGFDERKKMHYFEFTNHQAISILIDN